MADGPVVINRMGCEMQIQRSTKDDTPIVLTEELDDPVYAPRLSAALPRYDADIDGSRAEDTFNAGLFAPLVDLFG